MLPTSFEDIESDHVLKLVDDKITERKTLEYKERLTIGNTEEKAEFLSDISSFANTSGGDIIFGISDERDEHGNATGIPAGVVGLKLANSSQEQARIEQLIESGIQPRIPVTHIKSLEIPGCGVVIIVRIGKSWIAPHMVSYANRTRFFSRNNTGKLQLDVQQIGAAFALQRSLGERLRAWKVERIAKVLSEDESIPFRNVSILYHFVSAAGLMGEQPSFPRIFDSQKLDPHAYLMSLSPETHRYNVDGLLIYSKVVDGGRGSYLQIFKEGSLEYGDAYCLENGDSQIKSRVFEQKIVDTFSRAIGLLKELESIEPLFASVTLLGVKNRVMTLPDSAMYSDSTSESFDRNVISSPDVRLQNLSEKSPFRATLLPIVDSIWQGAGMKHSPYRQDGVWDPNWKQPDGFAR